MCRVTQVKSLIWAFIRLPTSIRKHMREPTWLSIPNESSDVSSPTTTWLQMLRWLDTAVYTLLLLPLIGGAYFPPLRIWADLGLLWPLECGRSGVQPVPGLLVRGLSVFAPSLWEYWLLKSSFHWEVRLVNPLHCEKTEPHWEVPDDETQCWRETRSTEAAGMWVRKPPWKRFLQPVLLQRLPRGSERSPAKPSKHSWPTNVWVNKLVILRH